MVGAQYGSSCGLTAYPVCPSALGQGVRLLNLFLSLLGGLPASAVTRNQRSESYSIGSLVGLDLSHSLTKAL
jgi:hypothetical protein